MAFQVFQGLSSDHHVTGLVTCQVSLLPGQAHIPERLDICISLTSQIVKSCLTFTCMIKCLGPALPLYPARLF